MSVFEMILFLFAWLSVLFCSHLPPPPCRNHYLLLLLLSVTEDNSTCQLEQLAGGKEKRGNKNTLTFTKIDLFIAFINAFEFPVNPRTCNITNHLLNRGTISGRYDKGIIGFRFNSYACLSLSRRNPSHSSVTSSDNDDDDDDEDYDGEYESVTTSSEEDEEDSQDEQFKGVVPPGYVRSIIVPPRPPQRRHQLQKRHSAETSSDTSTEVGSDDLSSDEDSSSEDEFSSGSATECEFTDSEGRPNPFHKQLELPKLTVQAASPVVQRRRQLPPPEPSRPMAPVPKAPEPAPYDPSLSSLTYASQYQYKTPNLSGRLQNEQQKSSTTIQDFSTRRALNLKKNWVSEAQTNVATNKKVNSSEIDNRLKSLMDRLSNQQKLLKPADKPSQQMQHFLSSTSNAHNVAPAPRSTAMSTSVSMTNGSASLDSSSPSSSLVKSPPLGANSPPDPKSATSSQRYYNAAPPVYKSMSNDSKSEKAATTASSAVIANESGSSTVKKEPDFKEVESLVVPELPPQKEPPSSEDDDSSEEDSDASVELATSKPTETETGESTVKADLVESTTSALSVPNPNVSGSSRDGEDAFESCNEEPEPLAESINHDMLVEAVNPSLAAAAAERQNDRVQRKASLAEVEEEEEDATDVPERGYSYSSTGDNNALYQTPGSGIELSDIEKRSSNSGSKEAATHKATPLSHFSSPLATSSPFEAAQAIDFIDDGAESPPGQEEAIEDDEVPPRPPAPPPPLKDMSPPPLLAEEEFTSIYRERNPTERLARTNVAKQKEKSIVADMILSRVGTRSSSAVRRSARVAVPTSSVPPIPTDQEQATTPVVRRGDVLVKKPAPTISYPRTTNATPAVAPNSPARTANHIEQMDFPLIDDELSTSSAAPSAQNTPVKKISLPATPLTNPEKFGIKTPNKNRVNNASARNSRPTGRHETTSSSSKPPTSLKTPSSAVGPASPSNSTNSSNGDMEYMDGILSTDESPSKTSSSSKSGKDGKKTFMKTISGIFSRSSSLSAMNRNPRISLPATINNELTSVPNIQNQNKNTANSLGHSMHTTAVPTSISSSSSSKAQSSAAQNNFKFPRLGFRSSSVNRALSPDSPSSPPSGEAPRADISELGSLASLSTSTPKKDGLPMPGVLFRTASLSMQASHPSTPPVPLTRKITIGSIGNHLDNGGGSGGHAADSLSENEENESPETSLNSTNSDCQVKNPAVTVPETVSQLPPEILEKILRRGGKTAKRHARVAEVKRVRKAQEIQRQLEELDVQQKELEDRGIRAEQSLRGERVTQENISEAELMQTWFGLLSEKNRLVRREQELLVTAKHLELEDKSARYEGELRDHLMLDSRSPESVVREGEILKELLEISEQREKLQAMLEKDQQRYQKEDKDIEAQMMAKGLILQQQQSAASAGNPERGQIRVLST